MKMVDIMDLTSVLSNPVRIRILQYLQSNGEATTRQMSEELSDIPAPTLYRHVNYLIGERVLKVAEERKVRGTTERLLAIDEAVWAEGLGSDIAGTAYQFLMAIYGSFSDYGRRPDADPERDMLCLRTCVLRLDDDAFASFLSEYKGLLEKYQATEGSGRTRSISIISSPVDEGSQ